jgi:hypothetical protein
VLVQGGGTLGSPSFDLPSTSLDHAPVGRACHTTRRPRDTRADGFWRRLTIPGSDASQRNAPTGRQCNSAPAAAARPRLWTNRHKTCAEDGARGATPRVRPRRFQHDRAGERCRGRSGPRGGTRLCGRGTSWPSPVRRPLRQSRRGHRRRPVQLRPGPEW